jgi:hypothetical protein
MDTHQAHRKTHKYAPLREFLRRQSGAVVRMSFNEIERVIGAKLPPTARHRAWWSNNEQNSVMTKAWKDAGFESEDVDIKGRRVAFRRVRADGDDAGASSLAVTVERHPLIGWMKGTLTIAEGVDLAKPADPEWGEATYGDTAGADRK